MKWSEFITLLAGLGNDTPLGRVVAIRTETDNERLKYFSPSQRKMRNEWQKKKAMKMSKEQTADYLESLKQAFMSLAK